MRSDLYTKNIRPDGTASYLEINPEPPPLSSRNRGWDGIVVERERFFPFDNGEVVFDEHFLAIVAEIPFADALSMRRAQLPRALIVEPHDLGSSSPANQPVRWRLDGPTDALIVAIQPRFLERVMGESLNVDPAKVQVVAEPKTRDPFLQQLIGKLLAEVGSGAGRTDLRGLLANILAVHLLRHYSTLGQPLDGPCDNGLSGPRLRRAIDAIRDRLESGVSLAEVAEAAGVSSSHFAVLFKRSTGLSPHQYLIQCRIDRAKELLHRGDPDLTLAQIAARVGFCDQSHLTRHFRRLVGVTPGRFRETP